MFGALRAPLQKRLPIMFTHKISSLMAAAAVALCGSLGMASASSVLYESTFPTASFGGPCSPCGTRWRVFDLIDLGAPGMALDGIEFAIHDITPGGADQINVSFFDTSENLLHSVTQSNTQWNAIDPIDGDNFTVSFALADLLIGPQSVYVSIFGIGGTQFGLFQGGGGDGVAAQLTGTTASGFAGFDNRNDVAIRITGAAPTPAPVPLPAALPMLLVGIGALGFVRRRKG